MSDAALSLTTSAVPATIRTARDTRLDFYRGLAMFIILIAHIPNNKFALWIPARFGFSDATEIFVFCSGMASAIAFGRVFSKHSWGMGSARVAFRVWQVYWTHIGLFLATTVLLVWLTSLDMTTKDHIADLNLWHFLMDSDTGTTRENLVGLFTLRYVPNYFDILPMYLVLLALMPVMMGLARVTPLLSLGLVLVLWTFAQTGHLWMPAEPWSDREWYFNPFGWQLIFFTGFALVMGWIPAPPVNPALIALALAVVLLAIPPSYFRIFQGADWAMSSRVYLEPWFQKTDFGPLRYIHFLSLAYLGWVVAGDKGSRIAARGQSIAAHVWRFLLAAIMKVGQQSLAVFVTSMFLAQILGAGLDYFGRSNADIWVANLTGFVLIVLTAHLAGWFKSQPWRAKRGT